jgi:hypothetical protein
MQFFKQYPAIRRKLAELFDTQFYSPLAVFSNKGPILDIMQVLQLLPKRNVGFIPSSKVDLEWADHPKEFGVRYPANSKITAVWHQFDILLGS